MINYEAEVKKRYPDADIFMMGHGYRIFNKIVTPQTSMSILCDSEQSAWQSAYNNLKQQGKL